MLFPNEIAKVFFLSDKPNITQQWIGYHAFVLEKSAFRHAFGCLPPRPIIALQLIWRSLFSKP